MADLEAFVNGNPANVTMDAGQDQGDFEAGLLVPYDNEDDGLFPVIVYLMGDEPVAWYDMENAFGYVVPQEPAT